MNSEIKNQKRIILSNRQLCDIELIIDGSFNPLDSFLNKEDYESVLENMRLSNGDLWPIPVCLDLDKKEIDRLEDEVSLTDKEGYIIANMSINDIWEPDKKKEALAIFGTLDESHPGVYKLFNNTKKYYVGGKLKDINQVRHYDYLNLRHPPKSVKNFINTTKDQYVGQVTACWDNNRGDLVFNGCFKTPCSDAKNRFQKRIGY